MRPCVDAGLVELRRLADVVAAIDVAGVDRDGCVRVLEAVASLRRRLDGCEVRVTRRIAELADHDPMAPPAEHTVAGATRRDPPAGARARRRDTTTAALPELGAALDRGDTSGEHIDVIADVLAHLPPALRQPFRDRHDSDLAAAATTLTPRELRRLAAGHARRLDDEHARQARFERQRRAVRLRSWVDHATGMVHLAGQFDPATGQAIIRRLHDETDARFHTQLPDTCPDDPHERHQHLSGLALAAIVLHHPTAGTPARRPETITVIDAHTLHHGWHPDSYIDHGLDGIELPLDTIRHRTRHGDTIPIWVDPNGVVIRVGDPAAPLDLGRSTRLANRAQRRALRVMYPTCAIPGCHTPYDHCQPHHLHWWRHGGRTDLANLLPLCSRHHHLVHQRDWTLTLQPDRSLTVHQPDGTTMHTGPPRHQRP